MVQDIKLANILLDSFDQLVLAYFGIAKVVSTATRRQHVCSHRQRSVGRHEHAAMVVLVENCTVPETAHAHLELVSGRN